MTSNHHALYDLGYTRTTMALNKEKQDREVEQNSKTTSQFRLQAATRLHEVGMNNTVEVYFEDEDETEVFKLVTSVRGSSLNGKISIESPMGKAVLGHKVNDRVYVKVNENTGYYVVIKSIENTGDSDEDAIRRF